jgi:hypothetical protein
MVLRSNTGMDLAQAAVHARDSRPEVSISQTSIVSDQNHIVSNQSRAGRPKNKCRRGRGLNAQNNLFSSPAAMGAGALHRGTSVLTKL